MYPRTGTCYGQILSLTSIINEKYLAVASLSTASIKKIHDITTGIKILG
jgi:hypothetical protein